MGRPRTTNKHLPPHYTIIGNICYYRPPGGGTPVHVADKNDLAAIYTHAAKTATPGKPLEEACTLSQCFDRYEKDCLPELAPRTQKDYRRHIATLRKWCGTMRPAELKPRDIGRFLDVQKGKIQRNRVVAVLSAIYTKMVGRWYVAEVNPCLNVERNEAHKRTRYVTDVEFNAVRALMPPRMQVAMDLALLTGQRQGDLLTLTWQQVTEDGVLFRQGKTGKRLLVAHSEALQEVLLRAKRLTPQLPRLYVIRKRNGEAYTGEGFRAIWQRVMRKAKKLEAIKERFTFHDLRAKSVSDSTTLEAAFERAGHTSMAMTRGVYDRGIRKVQPLK